MGEITMRLPLCDVCHQISLPSKQLRDGSTNPAFGHPELQKRCGKCKSPLLHRDSPELLEMARKAAGKTTKRKQR